MTTARHRSRSAFRVHLKPSQAPWSLNAFGFAIAMWGIFFPKPYIIAVLALAVAPFLACMLVVRSDGRWTLVDQRGDKRPDIGLLFLLPTLTLGARGIIDVNLIDWRGALLAAGGLGIVFAAIAIKTDRLAFAKPLMSIFLLLTGLDYGWGVTSEADSLLDRSSDQVFHVAVLGKWVSSGRNTNWHLTLAPWGPHQLTDTTVSRIFYDQVRTGQTICAQLHPGALNFRWYAIKACPII